MVSGSSDPRDDLIATICKSKCIKKNLSEMHYTCRSDKISVCNNLTFINVTLVRVMTVYKRPAFSDAFHSGSKYCRYT